MTSGRLRPETEKGGSRGRRGGASSGRGPCTLDYAPGGKAAIVMVGPPNSIECAGPNSFRKLSELQLPGCSGPNHADFSANGRYFVLTCEFSGELVKVSTLGRKVIGHLKLDPRATATHAAPSNLGMSMPQDIRLSPDGKTFYVADMGTNELRLLDAATFRQRRVIWFPSHPHWRYPSRAGQHPYIPHRGAVVGTPPAFPTNPTRPPSTPP